MYSTRYCCHILIKLEFSQQIFEQKSLYIKFHQYPSIGSPTVPCRRTDMTKLIVVFGNFGDARNKIKANIQTTNEITKLCGGPHSIA